MELKLHIFFWDSFLDEEMIECESIGNMTKISKKVGCFDL